MKKALITGITGQDGSYLAELLVAKGYDVHGLLRRISQPNFMNLAAVLDQVSLHSGDMLDGGSLTRVIHDVEPDEIYNLAGMSQVRDSYDQPGVTMDINSGGLIRILEACRALQIDPKVYQACSSEMFGKVQETPQNEKTPFYPRSPYGQSKVSAYNIARIWREAYGMKIYCGILFNHESPRRGEAFLSRKVCKAVAEIACNRRTKMILGNLDAKRDWGYAKEYVEWIYAIMQHPTPDDFVIATGESHSVREFIEYAFACVGILDWERYVDYDRSLTRPAEVDVLCGDASKSARVLGFTPKVKFKELIEIMVEAEMEKLSNVHEDDRRILVSYPEAKVITFKQNAIIGGHFHRKKTELFILSEGHCTIKTDDLIRTMEIGRIYTVLPGEYHEFQAREGTVLIGLNSHPYDPTDDVKVAIAK